MQQEEEGQAGEASTLPLASSLAFDRKDYMLNLLHGYSEGCQRACLQLLSQLCVRMLLTLWGPTPSCAGRAWRDVRGAGGAGAGPGRSRGPAVGPAAAGRGPGAPRAAAAATFPLLLAPSRGPPQKAQLRRPRSACTAAAPGIPPLRGPPAPGSPLRLLAVIQPAEWVGNETAVWAVVLGQAHRSPCKVKI